MNIITLPMAGMPGGRPRAIPDQPPPHSHTHACAPAAQTPTPRTQTGSHQEHPPLTPTQVTHSEDHGGISHRLGHLHQDTWALSSAPQESAWLSAPWGSHSNSDFPDAGDSRDSSPVSPYGPPES